MIDKVDDVPVISVIMPVYNTEKYVGEAIESILNQSYRKFEFLIFNDGSTDQSADVVQSYKDDRIKFFNYEQNSGYVKHLNYGIKIAKGKYIARMDADDISDLQRLEMQVAYMETNPEVGVCGSWYDIIGDSSTIITVPSEHDDLAIGLLLNSVFGHPSVIMRTKVLRDHNKYYDVEFMPAEDFKMWVDLSKISRLANLSKVLLHYRRHEGQISHYQQQIQLDKIQSIREIQVEYILQKKLTAEERRLTVFILGTPERQYEQSFLNKALKLAYKLIKANARQQVYAPAKFKEFVFARIKGLMDKPIYKQSLQYNRSLLFNKEKLFVLEYLSAKDKIKFYIKCALNWRTS